LALIGIIAVLADQEHAVNPSFEPPNVTAPVGESNRGMP